MSETTHILTFLGTGASCGVPSFYCGCKACDEARGNPRAARNCSDLLISGTQNTLIDAAPELRLQLIREQVCSIDQLVVTHGHFDHIGGIPQLEYYVKLRSGAPVPVYAGQQTLETIEQQFGFMTDALDLNQLTVQQTFELDSVRYTALPATHGGNAFGYLIQTPMTRAAYFPDTGPLPVEVLEHLEDLDLLIIDATFCGRNWMSHSHHSVSEAIGLGQQLRAKKTILTHLSMHYDTPTTMMELEQQLSSYEGTVQVAYDGLRIGI